MRVASLRATVDVSDYILSEENSLLTLLRLPAVDPLAKPGRQEALNRVEDTEYGRKGDPPRQSATQRGLGGEVVGDEVSDGYGHGVDEDV